MGKGMGIAGENSIVACLGDSADDIQGQGLGIMGMPQNKSAKPSLAADITYVPMDKGFMYLVAMLATKNAISSFPLNFNLRCFLIKKTVISYSPEPV